MSWDAVLTHPTLKLSFLVLDIALVYVLIYRILYWLDRSRAFNLIKGLFLVFIIFLISNLLQLSTLNWILEKFTTVLLILVVIIFQPELRRFLERIGSTGQFLFSSPTKQNAVSSIMVHQILKTVNFLSREKIGALIVLERETPMERYVDSGIPINGELQSEMLSSLFWPGSPTHDGAVIIRGSTILGAGCFLPLTETRLNDRRLGTRHRAALGLAEISDALVIIVSEETGVISIAEEGAITRFVTKEALETRLFSVYKSENTANF